MNQTEIDELERMVKDGAKIRIEMRRIQKQKHLTESMKKRLALLADKLEENAVQVKPVREQAFAEIKRIDDALIRSIVKAFFLGMSVKDIAEIFSFSEMRIRNYIKMAEVHLINAE